MYIRTGFNSVASRHFSFASGSLRFPASGSSLINEYDFSAVAKQRTLLRQPFGSWHTRFVEQWCALTEYWWKSLAPCGLQGCKNGPAPFPGRMSYKATKPGLVSVLYLSMFFLLCYCLLGPLLCIVSFHCIVLSFGVVLVKLSLLAKLLARKTPLSSESSPLQFLALA